MTKKTLDRVTILVSEMVSFVKDEIALVGERLSTFIAGERFLPCVGSDVVFEVLDG